MFKGLKKGLVVAATISLLSNVVPGSAFASGSISKFLKDHGQTTGPEVSINKNVIVLIPDGCDESVQTLSRWYKGEDLQVDSMQAASMKIHMANSVITGSAAAATAFSSGHKTTVRFLGVGPRTSDLLTGYESTANPYAPVATVLEAAKLSGRATGLVATSRITHATPAAYASHIEDRGWDNDIMEHLVYNNLDVAFGGGARHLIPKESSYTTSFGTTWSGKRTDGENLMEVLTGRGYTFVDNKDDMSALTSGKVWGLFDDSHLDPDMDREANHPTQPSIAAMTEKAIELLSQNENGFFLMVEGSQVDWAGHNNDPAYMVTDFLAFDKAVKAAVDFAKEDGNTIVLAFPDHNTGGMTIGNREYNGAYTNLSREALIDPIKGMTMSSGALVATMDDWSVYEIKKAVQTHWNLTITDEVAQEIIDLAGTSEGTGYTISQNYALARVICKHYTAIGWTSHGHDGGTVPVWSYGLALNGTLDNTDIAKTIAEVMEVDLDEASSDLYVDIRDLTSNYVIDIVTDENGDIGEGEIGAYNGILKVGDAQLPISKDYMTINGNTYNLPGVTVYASGDADVQDTVYISREAAQLLTSNNQL